MGCIVGTGDRAFHPASNDVVGVAVVVAGEDDELRVLRTVGEAAATVRTRGAAAAGERGISWE